MFVDLGHLVLQQRMAQSHSTTCYLNTYFGIDGLEVSLSSRGGAEAGESLGQVVEGVWSHGLGVDRQTELAEEVGGPGGVRGVAHAVHGLQVHCL